MLGQTDVATGYTKAFWSNRVPVKFKGFPSAPSLSHHSLVNLDRPAGTEQAGAHDSFSPQLFKEDPAALVVLLNFAVMLALQHCKDR
jgi:hypothetical protein